MNVVDSSGWIEALEEGPNASIFKPLLADTAVLIVPAIVIYEVFKFTARHKGDHAARVVAQAMQRGHVVEVDARLAITAAQTSRDLGLAMADSLIYATAQLHGATLWTQDDVSSTFRTSGTSPN
jgi:predicted nucleic acid-binding protein